MEEKKKSKKQTKGFQKPVKQKNETDKKADQQDKKEIKQQKQESSTVKRQTRSSSSFQPRSSVVQSFQKSQIETQQDNLNFENVLNEKKIKESRPQSVDSGKKKFILNIKEKSKITTQQLNQAKKNMKNPLSLQHKQSSEIDVQDEITIGDLEKQSLNALQPTNKKKRGKREVQLNTLIDSNRNFNEQMEQEDEDESQNSGNENDHDQRLREMIEEKYGTMFEPNVVPFKNPKDKKQGKQPKSVVVGGDKEQEAQQVVDDKLEKKQGQKDNFYQALNNEDFVLMQFPTKFLYNLPANFERRNRIQRVNRDNYGDNKEILNLDVQRRFDSAGIKILQYNGDINHYVDNWQQVLQQKDHKVGYKMGKFVVKKDGRCKFVAGESALDIERGISTNCQQDLSIVDVNKNQFTKVDDIKSKFIAKPNIDEIYDLSKAQMEEE